MHIWLKTPGSPVAEDDQVKEQPSAKLSIEISTIEASLLIQPAVIVNSVVFETLLVAGYPNETSHRFTLLSPPPITEGLNQQTLKVKLCKFTNAKKFEARPVFYFYFFITLQPSRK